MNGEDDALVPVWQVARILQLPSTQALWRMLHAGVMQVVWDKGAHAVPRASLTAYLKTAMSAIPEERAADEGPLDESPFSYCRAAAHVRRKINDGTLQPGDRVVAKKLAEESNLGLDSARRGPSHARRPGRTTPLPRNRLGRQPTGAVTVAPPANSVKPKSAGGEK